MASIVTSLDAATGRTVWQGRLGVAQREGFSASPVAVDGNVFFTNDDGETFVLRAGPTFDLLRVNASASGRSPRPHSSTAAGTSGRAVTSWRLEGSPLDVARGDPERSRRVEGSRVRRFEGSRVRRFDGSRDEDRRVTPMLAGDDAGLTNLTKR